MVMANMCFFVAEYACMFILYNARDDCVRKLSAQTVCAPTENLSKSSRARGGTQVYRRSRTVYLLYAYEHTTYVWSWWFTLTSVSAPMLRANHQRVSACARGKLEHDVQQSSCGSAQIKACVLHTVCTADISAYNRERETELMLGSMFDRYLPTHARALCE